MSSDHGLQYTDDPTLDASAGCDQVGSAIQNPASDSESDSISMLDEVNLNTQLQEAMAACAPGTFSKFRLAPADSAQAGKTKPKKAATKTTVPKSAEASNKRATRQSKRKQLELQSPDEDTQGDMETVEPKKSKPPKKKKKTSTLSWISAGLSDLDDDDDEIEVVEKKRKRKGKGKVQEEDSEDDDDEIIEVTAYIYVERPMPKVPARSSSSSRPHKPTDEEKYAAYGLITFSSKDEYTRLLSKLATQLPCSVSYIPEDKIMWKFRTPANSTYLALGGEIGYNSLIKQLRSRKPDNRIILLAMPPPAKPVVEEPHWPTVNEDMFPSFKKQSFDYDALDLGLTDEHISQQKMTFDKAVGSHMNALLERYPINNNPLYPNMRVYHDAKMNAYFELTDTKLKLWASHLSRNTATVDIPPISKHFDYSSRITKITSPAVNPVISLPVAPAIPPTTQAAAPTSATASLIELMVLSMVQQQQQQLQRPIPVLETVPALTTSTLTTLNPSTASTTMVRSQPQSPAKFQLPEVSLAAFCERYGVSTRDQERLEKLEYQPGDKLDALEEADWKAFAGFTSLSWQRVLEKTRQFTRDARNGLWA